MDNKAYTTNDTELNHVNNSDEKKEKVLDDDAISEKAISEIANENGTKVKIDMQSIDEKEPATAPYCGMGKEDLLRFSETEFWDRFRLVSLLIFWGLWIALLGAVIGLTIVAPRCGTPPVPEWWQKTIIYQIYVRSFYDSDEDGNGDLTGVAMKLDYIKELGIDTILLGAIYQSTAGASGQETDLGYEITDHMAIDSIVGNMADFDFLLAEAHYRNISVILDFVPNYTGKDHPWFAASSASNDYSNAYWNYYVWARCGANNWLSVYSESAWTMDATRVECYLHQFLSTQPELNLRSQAVQEQLDGILRFWLDKGVDGFRVVASPYLFEDADFANETAITPCSATKPYDCLSHTKTKSQPEVYDMIARWRSVVDDYKAANGSTGSRILLTDGDVEVTEAVNYYGTNGRGGANLPINYQLAKLNDTCTGTLIKDIVKNWIDSIPSTGVPVWTTGDQDRSRLVSNVGNFLVNAMLMLKMTLPGVSLIYYGEEVGMKNPDNSSLKWPSVDPAGRIDWEFSRDGFRIPMFWDNSSTAGFTNSTGSTWLPIPTGENENPSNYKGQNATDGSHLDLLKTLQKLRMDESSLQFGAMHYGYADEFIFSYTREHEGFNRIYTAINFGQNTTTTFDLAKKKKVPTATLR